MSPQAPGSSPLTRGKLHMWRQSHASLGLIPAHAGKTRSRTTQPPPPWAHPRSRGENHGAYFGATGVPGSSPLTRGKPARASLSRSGLGLIPAHAGKTGGGPRRGRGAWAHPRSRGENGGWARRARYDRGSSPLTRGKLIERGQQAGGNGLIPAHAGKTSRPRASW